MSTKVLAFAGSLRKASYNRKLLALAVARARALGADVDVLDLHDVAMPLFDGDLEESAGLPPGAQALRARILAAPALLVVSPEYNHSIPGVLKNAIDWASRPPEQPFRGKIALLMGASPGAYGAARMLPDLRKVLSVLGVHVLPGQLALGRAGEAFDDQGQLKDPALARELERLVGQLLETTVKLAR